MNKYNRDIFTSAHKMAKVLIRALPQDDYRVTFGNCYKLLNNMVAAMTNIGKPPSSFVYPFWANNKRHNITAHEWSCLNAETQARRMAAYWAEKMAF